MEPGRVPVRLGRIGSHAGGGGENDDGHRDPTVRSRDRRDREQPLAGIVAAIVLVAVLGAAIWTYLRTRPARVQPHDIEIELPRAA